MAAGRKVTIEFLGNNRDLNRAMDDSVRRSGKFSGALKRAGKMAAIGLAAGAVIAAKGLYEMGQMAVEDEASMKQLETQLKNAAGATDKEIEAVEKMIDATARATGVADDELRPALGRLVTATGDVEKAQDLMALALDVSAGSGKSLDSVTAALAKAQNGSVGGLSKLGIATKNAKGETKSFAELQDDMAKKFKGASASAAETMQGKMARLKVALSEAGEAIGYKLLPIAADLADWFVNKGLPAIEKFGGWIRDNLLPIFERITETVKKVFGSMDGDVGGSLGEVKSTIMEVVGAIQAIWKLFGDDILRFTSTAFKAVMQVIKGALQIVRGVIKVFSSLFKGDWKGVWEGIKLIIKGALNIIIGILKQALGILKLAWKVAWTAIKALVGAIWDGIKTLVSNGADKVVDAIKAIPGKIRDLAGKFRDAGKWVITAMIDGLSKAGSFVSDIAGKVWDAVRGMLNAAIDKINAALEFTIDPPGPGTININPANIPHLAKGGVISRPTLALIGEDGPEAVVPLGRKNAPKGRLGINGGGGDLHVHIHGTLLDPVGTVRALEAAVAKYQSATGRVAFAR